MKQYVQLIKQILNDDVDYVQKEIKLRSIQNQVFSYLIQIAIDEMEQSFEYSNYNVEIDRKYNRTVQFSFGEITYERTSYVQNGVPIYPADEWLGVDRNKRNSKVLEYIVTQMASFMPYRKCAKTVELLTGMSVSKNTIAKLVKRYGEKKESQDSYYKEYPKESEKKSLPFLYVEGDGILVSTQGSMKSEDVKRGKKDIAVFIVHEGVEQVTKTRRKTKNLHIFADVSHRKAKKRLMNYLLDNYDLKNTTVIVNSDGGAGYTREVFREIVGIGVDMQYFIDRYHVSQKLKQRIVNVELIEEFQKAINSWDKRKLSLCLDTLESNCETEEDQEQFELLQAYFARNWKYMKPLHKRGYAIVKEGIGIMESQLTMIAYRMKRQGKAWGAGLQGMIQILSSTKNDDFKNIFFEEWEKNHSLDNMLSKFYRINVTDQFVNHKAVIEGKLPFKFTNLN